MRSKKTVQRHYRRTGGNDIINLPAITCNGDWAGHVHSDAAGTGAVSAIMLRSGRGCAG